MKILPMILAAVVLAASAGEQMAAVKTVPHELDVLLKAGHIQGAACSEQGVYLAHQLGIEKIGWDGKLLKRVDAPAHLGDIGHADGRIYGAFAIRGKDAGKQPGMVRVWNENLEVVAEKRFDVNLDGCVVLGDIVYVGVDRWGATPHAGCAVLKLDRNLNELGRVDVDLGYFIHYGVQTMATDGKDIFFGNYGAPADNGNRKKSNMSRLSADLKVISSGRLGCSEGFGMVPKSVSKRDTPVFFVVKAMGGNMQGWRKDRVNNPSRIGLDFYEYADGKFTDITASR